MKIKHLLLGLAVVAIMASCSKKQDTASTTTEVTPTEQAEAMPEEEQVEAPIQETAQNTAQTTKKESAKASNETKAPAAKEEAPAVDPCEAKIAAFEQFANDLAEAKKANGTAKGAVAYGKLVKQVSEQRASVKDCNNTTGVLKTRLSNAQAKVTRTIN